MLSDTHPDAEAVQIELLRRMSVAERIELMRQWTAMAVHLARQGIAKAHPQANQRDLNLLWIEYQYGRDLADRVRDYLERAALCLPTP